MGDLDRREFIRTALTVGAIAGATLAPGDAEAARCPKVPKFKRDRTKEPLRIQSEDGDQVEGLIDLTTVQREPDNRSPQRVIFEFFVDTYETGESVTGITDSLKEMALVDPDLHRPLLLLVTWGKSLQFTALMQEVRVAYTMFLSDGTPVRAKPAVTLEIQSDCQLPIG